MYLLEPNVKLADVAARVPADLRGPVYEKYLIEQQGGFGAVPGAMVEGWNDAPLYVFDEWTAYCNGACVGIDYGPKELGKRSIWADVAHSLEFTGYANALLRTVDELDPRHSDKARLEAFVAWQTARSLAIVDHAKVVFGNPPDSRIDDQVARLAANFNATRDVLQCPGGQCGWQRTRWFAPRLFSPPIISTPPPPQSSGNPPGWITKPVSPSPPGPGIPGPVNPDPSSTTQPANPAATPANPVPPPASPATSDLNGRFDRIEQAIKSIKPVPGPQGPPGTARTEADPGPVRRVRPVNPARSLQPRPRSQPLSRSAPRRRPAVPHRSLSLSIAKTQIGSGSTTR